MCTAINLDCYPNWSTEGKQPTVYRWIIWRSLRLLQSPVTTVSGYYSLRLLQLNEIEMIWIISPKKLLSVNHEHSSVENESVNQMIWVKNNESTGTRKPAKSTPVILQRHYSITTELQRRGDPWVSNGVFQLIANIKHRKPSNLSNQSLLVCNQPFHTSSLCWGK
jgi:hypothetical protein